MNLWNWLLRFRAFSSCRRTAARRRPPVLSTTSPPSTRPSRLFLTAPCERVMTSPPCATHGSSKLSLTIPNFTCVRTFEDWRACSCLGYLNGVDLSLGFHKNPLAIGYPPEITCGTTRKPLETRVPPRRADQICEIAIVDQLLRILIFASELVLSWKMTWNDPS
jgi:hypothetical protein